MRQNLGMKFCSLHRRRETNRRRILPLSKNTSRAKQVSLADGRPAVPARRCKDPRGSWPSRTWPPAAGFPSWTEPRPARARATGSAIEFLWFAVVWYAAHGIKVERILTDNGSCYRSWKFRDACCEFGIKHKRTRPYRPQTNGKAERFIRTPLKEWAYAQTYTHSWKRTANLPVWTQRYNFQRPHTVLDRKPPASKLGG